MCWGLWIATSKIGRNSIKCALNIGSYWIISPEEKTAQVFLLQNGLLLPWEVYGPQDVGKVNVLDGCFVELSKVFAE